MANTKPGEDISGIVGDYGQVYLAVLPEIGKLLVKWGSESSQQCAAQFNLSTLVMSPDMAIRQMTVSCTGAGSRTAASAPAAVSVPAVPPVSGAFAASAPDAPAVKKTCWLQIPPPRCISWG